MITDDSKSTPFHCKFENISRRGIIKIKDLMKILANKEGINVNYIV